MQICALVLKRSRRGLRRGFLKLREIIGANMARIIKRLGLIINQSSHPEAGSNIGGPCCIEVPDWLPNKLGKYYLYFADHQGSHIKMAYADDIKGPWKLIFGGVLGLNNYKDAWDHIASPDLFVDHEVGKLRLYFHARARSRGREQWSFAAISNDGVCFSPLADYPLAPSYLRVFNYNGAMYGVTK